MGSWSGHTLPGSLFIFFGLTWTIKTCYRYFFPHIESISAKRRCRVRWDMVEGGFILFGAGFGLLIEQLLPWEPWFHLTEAGSGGEFTRANNWSHSTMYAFFIVFAIIQILVMKLPKVMPHCLHHVALALAFGVEGYLFYFHTHGREELDIRVHTLMLFAIWPTSLVLLILTFVDNNDNLASGYAILPQSITEMQLSNQNGTSFPTLRRNENGITDEDSTTLHPAEDAETIPLNENNSNGREKQIDAAKSNHGIGDWKRRLSKRKKILTLQLCMAVLTILHGTWFWQAAYVLYPPNGNPWEQDNHKNVAFLTMFFTWHCLLAMAAVGAIFLTFGIIRRRKKNTKPSYRLQFQKEVEELL